MEQAVTKGNKKKRGELHLLNDNRNANSKLLRLLRDTKPKTRSLNKKMLQSKCIGSCPDKVNK